VLYVSADGPRPDRPHDQQACAQTRALVQELVDWPCQLHTRFLDHNVGVKEGLPQGISWFFDHVEEGIILEDDCVPHPSFFPFCAELLARYRHDSRVFHITGNNWQFGLTRGDGSYYASRYPHIWGWATWRRVWRQFRLELPGYQQFKEQRVLAQVFPHSQRAQRYWAWKFEQLHTGAIRSAWSYSYLYLCLSQHGLCLTPNVNLVTNVGYGVEGANVSGISRRNIMAFVPVQPLDHLRHPAFLYPHTEADDRTFRLIFRPPLWRRALNRLQDWLQP
jgi:hypothetical protein